MSLIRFDDFELDRAAYRLRRNGKRVAVEPKVLELLAFLIEHRHRMVSRQELLDAVWPDQYVNESVLTRSICEVRKALGETSREHGRVRTVHGRGYQFRGELEVVEAGTETEKDIVSTARPSPGRGLIPSPQVLIGSVLTLGLALAGWAWLKVGNQYVEVRDSAPSWPVAMTLLPIEPSSEDPEFAMLALSLTELLTYRLRAIPEVTFRAVDYSIDPSLAFTSLQEFAQDAGVTHIISGQLRPSTRDSSALLSVRLAEVEAGEHVRSTPLGAFEVPFLRAVSGTEQFTQVRDEIVERIVRAVLPVVSTIPSQAPMTDNVGAYRLYLQAIQGMQSNSCDGGEAVSLLEQAVERDPEFAQAWLRLAWAHYDMVRACGSDANHYQIALEAAERALALDPGLRMARNVEVTILVALGRIEDAYRLHTAMIDHSAVEAGFGIEYVLRFAGYLTEAEKLVREGLHRDPLFFSTSLTGEIPNTLLYQNRLDEYLDLLSSGDSAYHRFYRGLAEYLRGDSNVAAQVLEPAFRENPGDLFGRFAHALLSVIEGDPQTARSIVLQIVQQRRALGATDGEMTYKQAQLLALTGEGEGAIEEFRHAVESGFVCVPYFAIDPAMESIRDLPEFTEIYQLALERHLAFGREFGLTQALPDLASPPSTT